MAENVFEIPRKDFYKLSELCQYTDVQPYVVRFWESEFPQLSPDKRGSQPLYRREHIELVRRIKQLLHDEECTLAAARQRLGEEFDEASTARSGPELPAEPTGTASGVASLSERPTDDAVSRQRYEDAVDEIDTLRLQIKEADKLRRKAELLAKEASERAEQSRIQLLKASARIEKLLASLER